ncbi:MAG: diacylglycerol kinase family lipid kinase [Planctomycetota bacterium]|jgi:diacylglycerol kinase (ATP)|nr:diacylglycerol kinase family lipid kinase [Planctomycetota bacterium]MDP6763614.1 diacylglycerol kinase family lipid kinase [Planctomycetota bacterium]MDP6989721.1 diacylglycerol kinase family lipid kinase [Planctomycetota bacterium]
MNRPLRCIANPRTRRRRALERAAAALRVDLVFTRGPDDAGTRFGEALAAGCERVAVAGGDGMVMQAAAALRGCGVPLGIVPAGTGNDFARMLAIPTDLESALVLARDGRARPLDVGLVTLGERPPVAFANIANVGLAAGVVELMNRYSRRAPSFLAYPLATLGALASHRPHEVEIVLDGERRLEVARLTNLVIANGRHFGRGLTPAPDARPDDGLFDLLVLRDLSRARILRTFPSLGHGPPADDPCAQVERARTVEVRGATQVGVEADGESLGHLPARFEIDPEAVRVVCP